MNNQGLSLEAAKKLLEYMEQKERDKRAESKALRQQRSYVQDLIYAIKNKPTNGF